MAYLSPVRVCLACSKQHTQPRQRGQSQVDLVVTSNDNNNNNNTLTDDDQVVEFLKQLWQATTNQDSDDEDNNNNNNNNGTPEQGWQKSQAIIRENELNYNKQREHIHDLLDLVDTHNKTATPEESIPPDVGTALCFLRAQKFNCNKALRRMVKFNELMASRDLNRSLLAAHLRTELSSGVIQVLSGRDKQGKSLLVLRPGLATFDPTIVTLETYQKAGIYVANFLMKQNSVQLKGLVVIVDCSHVTSGLLRSVTLKQLRSTMALFQKRIAIRISKIFVIHANKPLVQLGCSFLTRKMRSRVVLLEQVEKLREYIDLRFLPIDCGGTNPETASQWTFEQVGLEGFEARGFGVLFPS